MMGLMNTWKLSAMQRRAFFRAGAGWLATAAVSPSPFKPHSDSVKNSWEPHSKELEGKISAAMHATSVPGVSLAIFQRGRIVWQRAFGFKDRESGIPVDTTTLFEAASMSKPVFAYVVLKLCEKGILGLDAPLTHYARHRLFHGEARLDLITARHVLSHTSGLVPDWRSSDQPLRIAFRPGEKWSYSGEGYYYLQSVITDLTGHTDPNQCDTYEAGLRVCATDFGEYMESRLIVPFGMKSSGYVWNDQFAMRRARPHDLSGNPLPYRSARKSDIARYGAAGGLMTTPTDYAKFMIGIVNPKAADNFHLTASSLKEMTTPQVKVTEAGQDAEIWWGLGWRIARTRNGTYFGHDGENPGFQCISEACGADRSGFVIMTNGGNGAKLLAEIAPEVSKRVHL
jgi:CubicO group peptidase (beta-lactamase class C family)